MESRKFEDAFKDAFKGAEVAPSENVWTNIELDLEKAEGDKMKRRLLFYKLLAAASVTFGMCVAGVGYYYAKQNQTSPMAQVETVSGTKGSDAQSNDPSASTPLTDINATTQSKSVVSAEASDATALSSTQNKAAASAERTGTSTSSLSVQPRNESQRITTTSQRNTTRAAIPTGNETAGTQSAVRLVEDSEMVLNSRQSLSDATQTDRLPSYIKPAYRMELKKEEITADPVALMFAKLDQEEKELNQQHEKEKNKNKESLWTSVGFSAGAFNSSGSGVDQSLSFAPPQNAVALSNVADQQASAGGVAYSMGVSVGTKISERWVLQGGLNYMTQTSEYTTNAVSTKDFQEFSASSLNNIQDANARLISSAPYSVNNNMQFISVPVQAGYLVVNNKVGLQLNAGVATDLFLQNTLTPESDYVAVTTQSSGDKSPYRTVNFIGLVGTEISYKFGHHYRMAINPGLRYPLSSIYKSEYIESNPVTLDIGLRFRYIFY